MKNFLMCISVFFGLSAFAGGGLTRSVTVIEQGQPHHYLGNNFGQTLYTFDPDTVSQSVCNGTCAEKWPPFLVSDVEAKALAAPYGTITRSNGLLQLTYNKKPLYTFFLDHSEGDDKGDGVGGVWHDIDFVAASSISALIPQVDDSILNLNCKNKQKTSSIDLIQVKSDVLAFEYFSAQEIHLKLAGIDSFKMNCHEVMHTGSNSGGEYTFGYCEAASSNGNNYFLNLNRNENTGAITANTYKELSANKSVLVAHLSCKTK